MKSITLKFLLLLAVPFLSFTTVKNTRAKHLEVGDAVPQFALYDQNNKLVDIKNEIGKHILVIYFYPKDESMVCTKEACSFRDSFNDFTSAGAKVIGVNGGTVESHKAFAEHYKLPFTLLSDPGDKVNNMFGVKSVFFMSGRETFVIGLDGKVAFKYTSMMQGKGHVDQALQYIKNAKKQS